MGEKHIPLTLLEIYHRVWGETAMSGTGSGTDACSL
jgi:hypothetical protein